jgi:hypothetical protein
MVAEKSLHLFGLVRREIIEDHMDGLLARLMGDQLGEEGDELGRGMSLSGAPQDVAGSRIERRLER